MGDDGSMQDSVFLGEQTYESQFGAPEPAAQAKQGDHSGGRTSPPSARSNASSSGFSQHAQAAGRSGGAASGGTEVRRSACCSLLAACGMWSPLFYHAAPGCLLLVTYDL